MTRKITITMEFTVDENSHRANKLDDFAKMIESGEFDKHNLEEGGFITSKTTVDVREIELAKE